VKPDRPHDELFDLLPWYVNGTLDAARHSEVAAHLAACPGCAREVAVLRAVAEALIEDEPADAPDAPSTARWRRAWWLTPSPMRWVIGGQAVAMAAALALFVLPAAEPADLPAFRTLTSVPEAADGLRLHVVFDPALTEASLRGLLFEHNLRFLDGPTREGRYTLVLDEDAAGDGWALAELLQERPEVRLAAPAP
jgi:hypothetical protein